MDDDTDSEIWTPWKPSVGLRVRIHVSPECPTSHAWADGATGVIIKEDWSRDMGPEPINEDSPNPEEYRNHWWDVEFDTPIIAPGLDYGIRFDMFAVIEMVPIDE